MRYDPNAKTDMDNIVKGIYQWTVLAATEKTSQAGYDYLNLQLAVSIPDTKNPLNVYAKLLTHPKMMWQIEQFCKATGLDFMDGNLEVNDCIGKQGYAEFDFGEPNDKGRKYLEVQRYLHDEELEHYLSGELISTQTEINAEPPTETDINDIHFPGTSRVKPDDGIPF
jgi:hypothetical protein